MSCDWCKDKTNVVYCPHEDNEWLDAPNKPGVWACATPDGRVWSAQHDAFTFDPRCKYKFIGTLPVPPKPVPATDAEIAGAVIEYFTLLSMPAVINSRTKEVWDKIERLAKTRI